MNGAHGTERTRTRPGSGLVGFELGFELFEVGVDGSLHCEEDGSEYQILPPECETGEAEDATSVLFGFDAEAPLG